MIDVYHNHQQGLLMTTAVLDVAMLTFNW
ncbi:hypothetical protein VAEKB19_5460037 [Vibrio aestuarianus]|nr:hypothetical protein VAEKB19_5460037 [Vibrio aestuarianus]